MRRLLLNSFLLSGIALLGACGGGSGSSPPALTYDLFNTPELVPISGYSDDIMEPFFSRDGQYLFFNDNYRDLTPPPTSGKNLHYATYDNVNDEFTYAGVVGPGINDNRSVQGVPTLDSNNQFYFVDTKFYDPLATSPVYITLFSGVWTGTTVTGVSPVIGLDFPAPGFLNFDLEISPDGNTLWFNDGYFSGNPFPDAADIKIANFNTTSGFFERDVNVDIILANVNTTTDLEYAPAITADGLELLFTRLDLDTMEARIYRTTRPDNLSAFTRPQLVSAINSFAEGATFSPDEKTVYFHWHNQVSGKFELYRTTRP